MSTLADVQQYTPEILEEAQSIIDKGVTEDRSVWAWDAIKLVLIQHNLAWRTQEHVDRVAVHPANRSTFGVDGLRVHSHLLNIKNAGFSWLKCGDIVAIEIGVGNTACIEFTNRIAALSNGLLPKLRQTPKLASLGGGHTNFALRAVVNCCKTLLRELGDCKLDQGRISNPH